MSMDILQRAMKLAQKHSLEHVPVPIQKQIRAPGTVVYGIGGVHSSSLVTQTGSTAYSLADVMKAMEKQKNKTDAEIGTKYAVTDVSNLALVAGYMKALGIKSVTALSVNNANGIFINPEYWQ
jgi:exopolyphosphatase/guanosine-5'-triphosphate,3'-diphosphate pyrophosphatase